MKSFNFDFQEEPPNHITFEYSPEADEDLDTLVENGVPVLYANQTALLSLARLFIKMALGEYKDGFHVHLRKDLNADEPDRLIVMLHSSETGKHTGSASTEQQVITD
ncbi:hypothetical protein SBA4_2030002 [Candidatus Sulfopaludibacter sp. SbA4]|nr:hypothetical protein SBA4_2030002 [Candidatus Sulfopaludibacter sp. SbA4]